jgi:predicted hydrocarbon binding protein
MPSDYYYPNKIGRIILQGTEEILGRSGIQAVLSQAQLHHFVDNYPPNNLDLNFKFDELGKMQVTLEEMYGSRGGRGLALRSGRASFKYGLREFGELLGITELTFRLLPITQKLRAGVHLFAEALNKFSDQQVRVDETEERFLWHIDRCPVCWGRRADHPVCDLAVGILQESLLWASGGRHFIVEEKLCIAKGDPTCTIIIEKQPID